ncbi:transposase [Gloeobacter morelensis MG652769]|uniref:Transposase n=1 Tax=Gloeobacter morelensis MG652769 TaxID=2781736 RepID=A0ABY3PKM1_9CYAN|nr:transposase [Gloeobacter morelensis MG652769]
MLRVSGKPIYPSMLDIVDQPGLPLTPSGTRTVAWGDNPVFARAGLDGDCLLTELELYPMSQIWVGIDVAKARLDVAFRPAAAALQFPNSTSGIEQLLTHLRSLKPTLVVLEATGGLQIPVTAALAQAGIAVAVVNPRQVRGFARAAGQLAKTDALDAGILAPGCILNDGQIATVRPLVFSPQSAQTPSTPAFGGVAVDYSSLGKGRVYHSGSLLPAVPSVHAYCA